MNKPKILTLTSGYELLRYSKEDYWAGYVRVKFTFDEQEAIDFKNEIKGCDKNKMKKIEVYQDENGNLYETDLKKLECTFL